MRSITFKSKNSVFLIFPIILIFIVLGVFVGTHFEYFNMNRNEAYDLLKETLSNYISLLGIGLAILAIVFAIIQLAYKRLSIVRLVIEETYFTALFYFGAINIFFCSVLMTLNTWTSLLPDALFSRLVIEESYLFWIIIPLLGIVSYKTIQMTNFPVITNAYLKQVKKAVISEKKKINRNVDEADLQSFALEIKEEINFLIDEGRIKILNKFLDFFKYVISYNSASNLLSGFASSLKYWMIKSSKKEDLEIYYNLSDYWWNISKEIIDHPKLTKNHLLWNLPIMIYSNFITTKDTTSRKIAINTFPIRLKEMTQSVIYQILSNKRPNDDFNKVYKILYVFQDLLKAITIQNDKEGLTEVLQQLKLLSSDIKYKEWELKKKQLAHPTKLNEDEGVLLSNLDLLLEYLFSIQFICYCWLLYKIFSGTLNIERYKKILNESERYLLNYKDEIVAYFIKFLDHQNEKESLKNWIRDDILKLDGEAYWLPSEESILARGLISILSKYDFESYPISNDEIINAAYIRDYVNEIIKNYIPKLNIWAKIFNVNEKSEIDDIFSKTSKYFETIEEKRIELLNKDTATKPLSSKKVEDFKNRITSQWHESRTLSYVFEKFQAVKINPKEELKLSGPHRVNLQGGKLLFVEGSEQSLQGIQWGHQLNINICAIFISAIREDKRIIPVIAKNYLDGLDLIYEKESQPNIAFVALRNWRTISRVITQSGNFIDLRGEKRLDYPFHVAGIYRERIIIIPLQYETMVDGLIGLHLPGSMVLKRRENDDWIEKKLQVKVLEITDKNAEAVIKESNKVDIITKELIEQAKAGILIDIEEIVDFEILSYEGVTVVEIK